jgi:tetratricopeptide (TPR) repeat protein
LVPIDPKQFVQLVQPLLEQRDVAGLLCLIKSRWSADQVRDLLNSKHMDARKVALLAIALAGPSCCCEELATQLKDSDPVINQLAEHALWAIWFRSGKTANANQLICRGAGALSEREFAAAVDLFSKAIHEDPDFAEAYNQRGIAYYLMDDFARSMGDCRRAIRRMPCHFGAWAGMGHCHAHKNEIAEALECYEKSLEINPHLDCIRQTVAELRTMGGGLAGDLKTEN